MTIGTNPLAVINIRSRTAKHHKKVCRVEVIYDKQERNRFIELLQQVALEHSIRITILGGDVHLAALGRFYTKFLTDSQRGQDHRYMLNVFPRDLQLLMGRLFPP